MKYYHVTPEENYTSIMTYGLLPTIGKRSAHLESEPLIFMFPTLEDRDAALSTWLGEEFNNEEPLICLEIELPSDFPLLHTGVDYEVATRYGIDPSYIKFKEYV